MWLKSTKRNGKEKEEKHKWKISLDTMGSDIELKSIPMAHGTQRKQEFNSNLGYYGISQITLATDISLNMNILCYIVYIIIFHQAAIDNLLIHQWLYHVQVLYPIPNIIQYNPIYNIRIKFIFWEMRRYHRHIDKHQTCTNLLNAFKWKPKKKPCQIDKTIM